MAREIISKRTRRVFREFLVGTSLGFISDLFGDADIASDLTYAPPVNGQRRSLVEQYYHTLDLSRSTDVRRLVKVFESLLASADVSASRAEMVAALEADGFTVEGQRIRAPASVAGAERLGVTAGTLNAHHLAEHLRRIESAVDEDPSAAIGAAKELVETCCLTLLAERGRAPESNLELPKLVKATMTELQLVPDNVPDGAKGADVIRRMMSNLASVLQGVAELRNLYGTGHGKDGRWRGLQPRHARLAVNAATALAVFLVDTHEARPSTMRTS